MNIRDTRYKRGIFEIVFYVFIIGLVISLSVFAGFSLLGFQESFFSNLIEISSYLGSYLIYIPLLIVAILIIIFPIVNMIFIKNKEHPATQEGLGFLVRLFSVSYIYNPEQSFMWFLANKLKEGKSIKWSTNIMRVFFLSVILGLIVGILIAYNPQLAVSGVPQTAQQISVTSDVIFGAGIPSVAENGALMFIYFFLLGFDAILCYILIYRRTRDKDLALWVFFLVGILILAPLMGYLWGSYHNVVYGNSEASIWATRIFGFIGAELIILTGIFLWWLFLHFFNNFVLKIIEVSPLESDIVSYLWIALFLIVSTYISLELLLWRKKKRRIMNITY